MCEVPTAPWCKCWLAAASRPPCLPALMSLKGIMRAAMRRLVPKPAAGWVQLEQLLEGMSDRVDTLSLVPDMATSRLETQLQVALAQARALNSVARARAALWPVLHVCEHLMGANTVFCLNQAAGACPTTAWRAAVSLLCSQVSFLLNLWDC